MKSIKSINESKPSYEKKSIYSYNQTKIDDNKPKNIIDNKYDINKINNDNDFNYSKYRKVEIKKETVIKENTSNLNNDKPSIQNESQVDNKGYVGRFQFKKLINTNNNDSENKPYKSSRAVETEEVKTTTTENKKETDEDKEKKEDQQVVEKKEEKVEEPTNEQVDEKKEEKVEESIRIAAKRIVNLSSGVASKGNFTS